MKIIKPQKRTSFPIKVLCSECRSVLLVEDVSEITYTSAELYPIYYAKCPNCGGRTENIPLDVLTAKQVIHNSTLLDMFCGRGIEVS
jgi:hypothetical protein